MFLLVRITGQFLYDFMSPRSMKKILNHTSKSKRVAKQQNLIEITCVFLMLTCVTLVKQGSALSCVQQIQSKNRENAK